MRVFVQGAPGYEDFEGDLLMEVFPPDGEPRSIVGFTWEGKRDFEVFKSRYIKKEES